MDRGREERDGRKIPGMMMMMMTMRRTLMLEDSIRSPAKVSFHAFMYPDCLSVSLSQSLVWEFFCLLVTQT